MIILWFMLEAQRPWLLRHSHRAHDSDDEAMGIRAHWLVDIRALAAARALGKPKQPTITVCALGEDGYELSRYHAGDAIVSQILPELKVVVDDVFAVAEQSR